jgi:hypothetical protein
MAIRLVICPNGGKGKQLAERQSADAMCSSLPITIITKLPKSVHDSGSKLLPLMVVHLGGVTVEGWNHPQASSASSSVTATTHDEI